MTEAPQKKPLLEVIQTGEEDDETCRTFVMHNEDHTLGNSLRYVLMKSADVQFCGYSIPHPSETKINFRIQTNGKPATEVLKKGLEDLKKLCQHVQKTFEHSMLEYKESHPEDAEMVEDT
ncbi:DNA-directed RNA polymerases I and III subunit RPAC2-like isoform X1 [Haliotis cracherodii]|uniref:DNA-directed RNA polymerases I and III subunit RPAC2-like isoform X1 n=1 Tax=Haliotis cracherodii TaxID=6455 RepID=UPI0039E98F49